MTTPVITIFALGDHQTNCFVVQPRAGAATCWIVDCGYGPGPMLDHIAEHKLAPAALLLTHCHCDHIAGVDEALQRFGPLPIYVHKAEVGFCSDPQLNLSTFMGAPVTATEPDHLLEGGETLNLDDTRWRVLASPGHSPGGLIYWHEPSHQAIVGDTLFDGGIGRFDFPTSNVEDLRRSIENLMSVLPDQTTIYPGHGPHTTIGEQRRQNPFVLQGF